MITQTINLNLIPGGVLPRINVSQYDKGSRTLNFNIYNGSVLFSIPTGSTITIQGTKPDHTGFQYSCEYEGSVVTADLEQQMSIISGEVTCEITINKDLQLIGTGNFILNVEPAAVKDDTVISETELPLIEQAIEAAAEAEASAISAAESAEEAASWSAHPPYIGENGNWHIYDPETEEFVDTGDPSRGPQGIQGETGPKGDTGVTPDITMNASVDNTSGTPAVVVTETGTEEDPIFSLAFSGLKGPQGDTGATGETGPQGPTGPAGNGISNITKTGTSGLVDTYTITYTDGTTSTFTVTNGRDGTGSGDMSMSDYDPTGSVKNNGGIPDFIADQISGKQNMILASTLPIGGTIQTTVEGALRALNNAKQNIILSSALTIDGQTVTEVEPALRALNNKGGGHTIVDEEGTTYPARAKLKFINCDITDDSTNDTTIIEAEGGGTSVVASLNITTNNSAFYGQTITVSLSGSSVATGTFNNSGIATINVTGAGMYAVSVTAYGATVSQNVTVTVSGSYNVALNSDIILGAWLYRGGLDYTDYADFSEVEADEEAVRRLMTIHASVDYLAECGSATDSLVLSIINSDICAKWINLRDYALDTLYANTYIASMMDTADKYFYGEWVITDNTTTPPTWSAKGNVPVMTANDAPYGVASAGTEHSGYEAYNAFNGNNAKGWHSNNSESDHSKYWLQYSFTTCMKIKGVRIYIAGSGNHQHTGSIVLKGSNDGTNFTDVQTIKDSGWQTNDFRPAQFIKITNSNYYKIYRVAFVSDTNNDFNDGVLLQFYGRELRESVPTMTSNTAPYGVASADSEYSTSYSTWKAFDNDKTTGWASSKLKENANQAYIQYKFTEAIRVKQIAIYWFAWSSCSFEVLASNDDFTTSDNLGEFSGSFNGSATQVVNINPTKSYNTYRIHLLTQVGESNNYAGNINELQFYGLNYSEYDWDAEHPRHYLYDHGVELESLEPYTYGTGSIAERQVDQLHTYNEKASQRLAIFITSNTVDLSPWNVIRVRTGNILNSESVTDYEYSRLGVLSEKPTTYIIGDIANKMIRKEDAIPFSVGLDVSSINDSNYIRIGDGTYSTATFIEGTTTEWWLE